ncbi:ABC transporter substrate-binding protein, partial [Bacillus sp. SIMBA_008]
GGILDREVEITHLEDNADPTVAVTKLREYIATEGKPDLVMNSGPSTITEAMLPILTQNKIVSFNIGPTTGSGDPSVNPYSFDLSASVPDYLG